MTFKHIEQLDKFKKDLKKLLKRFPSLQEDLDSLVRAQLTAYHKFNVDSQGVFAIENLAIPYPKVFKLKKFACKSLKGKGVHSGIRVIYAYFPIEDRIEFIEIYYKGDQEMEDRERIRGYYASVKN
jgi:mRNA-degrading endonuclease RelE of RelBE toxin-antitoxin system